MKIRVRTPPPATELRGRDGETLSISQYSDDTITLTMQAKGSRKECRVTLDREEWERSLHVVREIVECKPEEWPRPAQVVLRYNDWTLLVEFASWGVPVRKGLHIGLYSRGLVSAYDGMLLEPGQLPELLKVWPEAAEVKS